MIHRSALPSYKANSEQENEREINNLSYSQNTNKLTFTPGYFHRNDANGSGLNIPAQEQVSYHKIYTPGGIGGYAQINMANTSHSSNAKGYTPAGAYQ